MKPFNKTPYEDAVFESYIMPLNEQLKVAAAWKANAERNTKIEAERPQSATMDIYSKLGSRVVYTGKNGYDGDCRHFASRSKVVSSSLI